MFNYNNKPSQFATEYSVLYYHIDLGLVIGPITKVRSVDPLEREFSYRSSPHLEMINKKFVKLS